MSSPVIAVSSETLVDPVRYWKYIVVFCADETPFLTYLITAGDWYVED